MNARLSIRNVAAALLVSISLTACGGNNDDLDEYINTIKARDGGVIDPLPEIKTYAPFTYVADAEGVRSPFVPDTPQINTAGGAGGIRPDVDRVQEHLESYSLDTLSMVGTLYLGETMYGLVQTSDGLIHRVIPGNYMGQNDGRITGISESEISLVEIISDGIGGFIERDAAVSLSD
ncbi:MAG: pilus assembly protein PilP [Pseudomonadota bacterium]